MSGGESLDFPIPYGKYELLERIGDGGMAEVFKARLPGAAGFEKTLVVKRILPHLCRKKQFVEMFVAEASLAAQVQHRNVVQVFELDQHENGEFFMVMEYVEGTDLRRILRSAARHQLRLPPWFSVHIIIEILEALQHAHNLKDDKGGHRNIVHRDVTPSNVFISNLGEAKLGDFGVAHDSARSWQTQAGQLKGKVAYMSPEQLYSRAIDGRSDLFAIGVVLWECLTQRRMFGGGPDIEVMNKIVSAPRRPVTRYAADVPEAIDALLYRAVSVDPKERFQSACEMQDALMDVAPLMGPARIRPEAVRGVIDVMAGSATAESAGVGPLTNAPRASASGSHPAPSGVSVSAPRPHSSGGHKSFISTGTQSPVSVPPVEDPLYYRNPGESGPEHVQARAAVGGDAIEVPTSDLRTPQQPPLVSTDDLKSGLASPVTTPIPTPLGTPKPNALLDRFRNGPATQPPPPAPVVHRPQPTSAPVAYNPPPAKPPPGFTPPPSTEPAAYSPPRAPPPRTPSPATPTAFTPPPSMAPIGYSSPPSLPPPVVYRPPPSSAPTSSATPSRPCAWATPPPDAVPPPATSTSTSTPPPLVPVQEIEPAPLSRLELQDSFVEVDGLVEKAPPRMPPRGSTPLPSSALRPTSSDDIESLVAAAVEDVRSMPEAKLELVPQDSLLAGLDIRRHASQVADKATAKWASFGIDADYRGPNPFWLRNNEDGNHIGPCEYHRAIQIARGELRDRLSETSEISADGTDWMSLRDFAMLTGLESMLRSDTDTDLDRGVMMGTLDRRSLASVFGVLTRNAVTGRLIVADRTATAEDFREIEIVDGRPTYVYASSDRLQLPDLLVAKQIVPSKVIGRLVHDAVKERKSLTALATTFLASDLSRYGSMFMKERLVELFSTNTGRFVFDDSEAPAHTKPFARSLIALLPELVHRGMDDATLEIGLRKHMNATFRASSTLAARIDEMGLTRSQLGSASLLANGRTIQNLIRQWPEDRHLHLTMAYALIESELLHPVV